MIRCLNLFGTSENLYKVSRKIAATTHSPNQNNNSSGGNASTGRKLISDSRVSRRRHEQEIEEAGPIGARLAVSKEMKAQP